MFPEPKEFVKVDKFVIKDSKGYYDRYWSKDEGKWVGLIKATRYTKEEADTSPIPENGVVMNLEKVMLQKVLNKIVKNHLTNRNK